jgi:hypothetical protein
MRDEKEVVLLAVLGRKEAGFFLSKLYLHRRETHQHPAMLSGPAPCWRDVDCFEGVDLESLAAKKARSIVTGSRLFLKEFTWDPRLPGPCVVWRSQVCSRRS